MKENIIVCFSGGKTSAFMCKWLINNMSHVYSFTFVYANTGLEHPNTLEFVDKCDKFFNLNLVWLEAVISDKYMVGTTFKIVSFETACRDNRLFKEMCAVYGLPNQTFLHCTRELKNQPIKKYAQSIIPDSFRIALGIRFDEFKRIKNRKDVLYPLATIGKFTKEDILNFWKKQPFDLEIEEHYGNCVSCYKKSDKKLKMIADENPQYFDSFIELENLFETVKVKNEIEKRFIFRGFRTSFDVKNNLKLPDNLAEAEDDDCVEECGSIFSDYESIPIYAEEKTLLSFL